MGWIVRVAWRVPRLDELVRLEVRHYASDQAERCTTRDYGVDMAAVEQVVNREIALSLDQLTETVVRQRG